MNSAPSPFISVVIPTCERNDEVAACLRLLAPGSQSIAGERYEVIVSDDGRDVTAEAMIERDFPWASWVRGPRRGIGTNRNNGAGQARGQWLVFIDSDTLPDRDCLAAYARAIENDPEAIAFEGAIHSRGDTTLEWGRCPENLKGGLFWTANVAIRREAFESAGGFDRNYRGYHEDQDLYLRLLQLRKVAFLPEAIVVHPVRITSFAAEMRRMPVQLADWAYHVRKHGAALGQSDLASVVSNGCMFHARTVRRELGQLHPGNALLSLCWIASTLFLLPLFYLRSPGRNAPTRHTSSFA